MRTNVSFGSERERPASEERARAGTALAAAGCDFALLSSPENVTYVSGYEVPVQFGAHTELSYGLPLALCAARDSASWLIVSNGAAGAAAEQAPSMNVLTFGGFDGFEATDFRACYLDAIANALHQAGLNHASATLGIEARALPYAVSDMLATRFPRLKLVEAEPALRQARLIKTDREITLLRRASALSDIAHNALATLIQAAGRNEIDMWAEISRNIFQAAGRDIPLSGELVTGPRSTVVAYPNGPRDRITETGDAALMDLSGRYNGYWFDCTNTHVVGGVEPTTEQRRFAKASQGACEAAMAALKPGALACDASAAAEHAFAKHGLPMAHYTGHQIGVTVNELPRLVPYDRTPIEPGMVFSVEPGAYQGPDGSFGARSEKMVLVTATGPEILSTFNWGV
ncbi:MAG TPA: Xaa-Pro peptidase family protein [Thermomicrobiales bacterium]|nr:Xaa-Pro peptidase family protein [Thermomicrobiales bacterium]